MGKQVLTQLCTFICIRIPLLQLRLSLGSGLYIQSHARSWITTPPSICLQNANRKTDPTPCNFYTDVQRMDELHQGVRYKPETLPMSQRAHTMHFGSNPTTSLGAEWNSTWNPGNVKLNEVTPESTLVLHPPKKRTLKLGYVFVHIQRDGWRNQWSCALIHTHTHTRTDRKRASWKLSKNKKKKGRICSEHTLHIQDVWVFTSLHVGVKMHHTSSTGYLDTQIGLVSGNIPWNTTGLGGLTAPSMFDL